MSGDRFRSKSGNSIARWLLIPLITVTMTSALMNLVSSNASAKSPSSYQASKSRSHQLSPAPIANAGPNQTVLEGSVVTLNSTGSSPGQPSATPLSYNWTITSYSGPKVYLSSTTDSSPSFIASGSGVYDFELKVTDTSGQSSTATTSVTVNEAPASDLMAQGSSSTLGTPSIISSSFSYPSSTDTYSAQVSWGDGTNRQQVPVNQTQGVGKLVASHLYSATGTYSATIYIISTSGDSSSVSATESVNSQVALWAGSTKSGTGISWVGADAKVTGLTHSNADINILGLDNSFTGPVQYGGSLNQGLSLFTHFSQTPQKVAPSSTPVSFDLSTILNSSPYSDETNSGCNNTLKTWTALMSNLSPGVYYAPCNVVLIGDNSTNRLTIISTASISLAGAGAHLTPYLGNLLFGTSSNDFLAAINIGSADENLTGYLYAPNGQINIGGLAESFTCGVVANTILIGGADFSESTTGCPVVYANQAVDALIPTAQVSSSVSETNALPGDSLTYSASVSDPSATTVISGLFGYNNAGSSPVDASGYDIELQYYSMRDSQWITLASQSQSNSNPLQTTGGLNVQIEPIDSPGVTYPTSNNVVSGTQVDASSTSMWSYVLSLSLSAQQLANLELAGNQVDISATASFTSGSNVVPIGTPIDLQSSLETLSPAIAGATISYVTPDGIENLSPTNEFALSNIALGSSVTVSQVVQVLPPAPIGTLENASQYIQRLDSLNQETLIGQAVLSTSTHEIVAYSPPNYTQVHLPIIQANLTSPPSIKSGDPLSFQLTLTNIGSAQAQIPSMSANIGTLSIPISSVPSSLSPGQSGSASFSWSVPLNYQGFSVTADVSSIWKDYNSNEYGPVALSSITQIIPANVEIPPGPPTNVSVNTPGIGDLNVNWSPPTFSGTDPITSYTVTATPATQLSSSLQRRGKNLLVPHRDSSQIGVSHSKVAAKTIAHIPHSSPPGTDLCLYPFNGSCAVPWPINPNPSALPPLIDPPTQWLLTSESSTPNTILIGGTCPTPSLCIAVGGTEVSPVSSGSGQVVPLVDVTTDGGGYWVETIPTIAPGLVDEYLYSVSCATANTCVAVGTGTTSSNSLVPVIERSVDGGGSWQPISVSVASGTGSLYGVACLNNPGQLSATTCIASGTSYGSYQIPTLLRSTDAGQTWQQVSNPASSLMGSYQQVACMSSLSCLVVGTVATPPAPGSNYQATVLSTSDGGSSWTLDQIASATFASGSPVIPFLDAISCISTSTCIAGGVNETFSSTGTITNEVPIAYYSATSGVSWQSESIPDTWPSGSFATVFGATCLPTSTGPCYLSGYSWASNGTGLTGPLLDESSNGGLTWQGLVIPNAPTSLYFGFTGINCNADSLCFAVGALYSTPSGTFYDAIAMSGPACGSTGISLAIRVTTGGKHIASHQANTVSVTITGNPPPTFADLTGLAPGTSYILSIIATSRVGSSCPAQISHISTSGLSVGTTATLTSSDFPDPDIVPSLGFGSNVAFSTHIIGGDGSIPYLAIIDHQVASPSYEWSPFAPGESLTLSSGSSGSWVDPNVGLGSNKAGGLFAPGVFYYDNQWIMFFDAHSLAGTSIYDHCIGVATSSSITGPYAYVGSTPLICYDGGIQNYPSWTLPLTTSTFSQEGSSTDFGAIDASPFVDPVSGKAYLLFKTGNFSGIAKIWAWQLDSTGSALVNGSAPVLLAVQSDSNTIEAPDMAYYDGSYYLFLAYGNFQSNYSGSGGSGLISSQNYQEIYMTCLAGPTQACNPQSAPLLGPSNSSAPYGPGSGQVFMDSNSNFWIGYSGWNNSCASYSCNTSLTLSTYRALYYSEISGLPQPLVSISASKAASCSQSSGSSGGYWVTDRSGNVYSYGCAIYYGSTYQLNPTQPAGGSNQLISPVTNIVGITSTPDGKGYWLIGSDGGVYAFGDAGFYGSMGGKPLNKPIVGMTATADGLGYWLVASDGGIFSFGDANFYGSMGGQPLNKPIVGMASTHDGLGYWLVASDGGIFSFGDATFYGSSGQVNPTQPAGGSNAFSPIGPIVGMAPTTNGNGYWFVDAGGDVYPFGNAVSFGDEKGNPLLAPVYGITTTMDGQGYWLGTNDVNKQVSFSFGDAGTFSQPLPSIKRLNKSLFQSNILPPINKVIRVNK